jgi:hypothetical protein
MAEQFASGYAMLIGVTENQVADWALPDVAKDISALKGVLTDPERCAYPLDHLKVVTGSDATRNGILDGLEWLQDQLAADGRGNATIVVYYTGHGFRDAGSNFYLIPYDVRKGKIRSRGLRAQAFAEAVGELAPQRLLVVLDCCHAGGMGAKGKGMLPEGYVGAAIPAALLMPQEKGVADVKGFEALAHGYGWAVLNSSTGEQKSYIRRDRKMSIFTYHLIEALTGHAQPRGGAVKVLVSDIMGYVTRKVPPSAMTDWTAKQEPQYQFSGENFPVALLLGGKGLSTDQPPPDPLESPMAQTLTDSPPHVATGGGAYVPGNVTIKGGDFVGRDQVVHGDIVGGNKIGRDQEK